MHSKLIGSILLIIGTSIGAGMLGLPIAAAQLGFMGSVILLIACWFIMMCGAFLILEVNLWLPDNTNLISMAKITLGPVGQFIAWLTYLLLLYALLCAYIASGSDLFQHLLTLKSIHLSIQLAAILFTLLLGTIVYLGINAVDRINRLLMAIKFTAFFLLLILLAPWIMQSNLATGNLRYLTSASAITVTATSFGWAILIPSLRSYFKGDVKKLKLAIFIGSTVPLFCYIAWDAVIMGIIPLTGDKASLVSLMHSASPNSSLVTLLTTAVEKNSLAWIIKLFTSVCVLTSFLGVALCLTDFFSDGLNLEKKGKSKLLIHGLTFIPALSIVLFFPNVFIQALNYAGIFSALLLILLPACMVWRGRYQRQLASEFYVPGGKTLLSGVMVLSLILIGYGFV